MQVYIGIDWSKEHHDVAFMNPAGAIIAHQTIPATPVGYAALDAQRQQLGAQAGECWIGIETVHNLILDDLLRRGYAHIYLIPPSLVKDSRGRFGANKAKSDRTDAHLLADLLRTDRTRLQPWQPNLGLTQQLTVQVSLERFLTRSIVGLSNRLRNSLWRYYPNATQVFSRLDTQIALAFIQAYPTPTQARLLTFGLSDLCSAAALSSAPAAGGLLRPPATTPTGAGSRHCRCLSVRSLLPGTGDSAPGAAPGSGPKNDPNPVSTAPRCPALHLPARRRGKVGARLVDQIWRSSPALPHRGRPASGGGDLSVYQDQRQTAARPLSPCL